MLKTLIKIENALGLYKNFNNFQKRTKFLIIFRLICECSVIAIVYVLVLNLIFRSFNNDLSYHVPILFAHNLNNLNDYLTIVRSLY